MQYNRFVGLFWMSFFLDSRHSVFTLGLAWRLSLPWDPLATHIPAFASPFQVPDFSLTMGRVCACTRKRPSTTITVSGSITSPRYKQTHGLLGSH